MNNINKFNNNDFDNDFDNDFIGDLEVITIEFKDYSDIKKASILHKELDIKHNLGFDNIHFIPELNLTLKKVENNTFYMGSNEGSHNEKPAHKVHITEPYWLGIYPITQEQYRKVMQSNPSHFVDDNKPVEKVSWNQAVKFCKNLTQIERDAGRLPEPYVYRLPIEAEWEYACKANQKEDFFIDVEDYVWYYKNSNEHTHEVGLKKPNPWGFFDMQGNVFEWCMDHCDFKFPDWYKEGNTLTPTYRDDAINPCWKIGSNRVAKGGAWLFDEAQARPSAKYINPPDSRYFVIGFRLALGLPV